MLSHPRAQLIRHSLIVTVFASAAALLCFFFLDLPAAALFKQQDMQWIYVPSREVTNIGWSIHYFTAVLLGYVFSKFLYPRSPYLQRRLNADNNSKIRRASVLMFRALVIVGICQHLIKVAVGRERPHVNELLESSHFDPFNMNWHWQSFPSGHSQVLFTAATVALLLWPRQKFLFLGLAAIFALTRVTTYQHFLSDIIGGGLIGYLGTLWIHHLWPQKA